MRAVGNLVFVVLVALLVVLPVRLFVFQPFVVRGASMEPNFHDGNYLIVDELSYRVRTPHRGEVIIFRFPEDPSQRYIKRVIGLPGETVLLKDNVLSITRGGEERALDESLYISSAMQTPGNVDVTLQENEYFVLGDNRPFSSDSRKWGALEEKYVIGRSILRVLPLQQFTAVAAPVYNEMSL